MKTRHPGSWVEVGILEATMLHRLLRWWVLGVFLAWALLLRVQEPWFLRREGLFLYWSGIEVGMVLFAILLPWSWTMLHGARAEGSQRSPRRALTSVSVSAFSIYIYGVLVGLALMTCATAVDALWGSANLAAATRLLAAVVALLLPAASLAPGLAALGWPIWGVTLIWALAWILSFQFGAPFPAGSLFRPELGLASSTSAMHALADTAVASLCATLGGLAFSLGITKLRR